MNVIYVNVENLSLSMKGKFLDYLSKNKEVGIQEKIEVWNKYAKSINDHVFISGNKSCSTCVQEK